jgi:putative hydrolase of the HAD superfamily
MIRALVIDLDDTLYDERRYVLSGFRAVAGEIASRLGGDPGALLDGMIADLDAEGRGRIFDRALERAGGHSDPALIETLVAAYRGHRPDITLWPGVADALVTLSRDYALAIVTDGQTRMQRRKVEALGVERLVQTVVYCWEHDAPKPSTVGCSEALRRLGAKIEEAVVIGDNPAHDMAAARALGCPSIRVRTGRFARVEYPNFPATAEVPGFTDVPALLGRGWLARAS